MNALDFCIFAAFLVYFGLRANMSLVYYLLATGGVFGGYILGLVLAPVVAGSSSSDLKKGVVSLVLALVLAALFGLAGMLIGRRVKVKVIQSRFFKIDKILSWPYKIIAGLVAIVFLSQSLVYMPILTLQFEAQGSTLLFTADKLVTATAVETLAQKIAPDQFKNLHLKYDASPPTTQNLAEAGDFQAVVNKVAPSVVKVSGRSCLGLGFGSGFVAAPGLVVTNAHVISGAGSLYISDHEGSYPATPLVIDRDHDLAVLYSKFLPAKPLPLSDRQAAAGAAAVSMGYPSGGDLQMAIGQITGDAQKSTHNKLDHTNTITLSAVLGKGSSGGPMFNQKGEVIGVNDAGLATTIAISSPVVIDLVEKAKGKYTPTNTDFCSVPPQFY